MSVTLAELNPTDWYYIVGTTITVGGALAGFIRWLWKKHKVAQELVPLSPIVPDGYDPQLRQKESDFLLSYLQQVQAQNTFLTFPGVVRSLPLEKILITPRLGAKSEVLLGQTSPPPTNNSAEIADPDLDRQLESGVILPWPNSGAWLTPPSW